MSYRIKKKKKLSKLQRRWIRFKFKHTLLTILLFTLTIILLDTALIAAILEWFKGQNYIGAFIGGLMSVSLFTTAPAIILLLDVSQSGNIVLGILLASIGSVLGDWIIIRFIEDEVALELKPILRRYHVLPRIQRFQRSNGRWIVSALGAVVVATPLPDEMGIALMNISHLKRRYLLIICFILNTIGITGIFLASRQLGIAF